MRTLVSVSVSGMGDRIRLLLSARALAPKLGREFLHVWSVNGHCGAAFEELFKCSEPIMTASDPWPNKAVINLKEMPWPRVAETLAFYEGSEVVKFHAFKGVFDQHDFGTVVQFSDHVLGKAIGFTRDHPFNRLTIGCHVRGTDYRWKTPPLTDYFNAIDCLTTMPRPEDQPIYLATDEFDVRREFKKKFGDRLMLYPITKFGRDASDTTIESAVELCLLRKCGLLALSGWSEFSRLACLHEPPPLSDSVVTVVKNV